MFRNLSSCLQYCTENTCHETLVFHDMQNELICSFAMDSYFPMTCRLNLKIVYAMGINVSVTCRGIIL